MGEHLVRELKQIKDQVEYILKNYPNSRNNDFYVVILWLKIFGGLRDYIGYIPFDMIRKLSGITSIWRVRKIIQNKEGKYLPTDPVRIKRQMRSEDFRRHIGKV